MHVELGNGSSHMEPHAPTESSSHPSLKSIERDLNALIDALALLGVKRCSQCRQFFRTADPGALFEGNQIVCYGCIPDWWQSTSGQLCVADRERAEAKLASWLRKHHNALIVKSTPGAPREISSAEFQIAVKCAECAGSGKLMEGERCRFCNGFGTVRIVVGR